MGKLRNRNRAGTAPWIAMKSSDAMPRPDGRTATMLYLDPTLVRALKRRALDEDVHPCELVERLLKESVQKDEQA